jgi:hypothetical protein
VLRSFKKSLEKQKAECGKAAERGNEKDRERLRPKRSREKHAR